MVRQTHTPTPAQLIRQWELNPTRCPHCGANRLHVRLVQEPDGDVRKCFTCSWQYDLDAPRATGTLQKMARHNSQVSRQADR